MPFTFGLQEHSTGVGVSSFATNLHLESSMSASATLRGEIYMPTIVNSPDARLEKELRHILEQRYYSPGHRSAFDALISTLSEAVHSFRQKQIPIELSAVSLVDNVAYLVSANGGSVLIIRDGVVIPLLETEDAGFKSASGFLQESDILILCTTKLRDLVSSEELIRLLNEVNDIEELKSILVEEMSQHKKPYALNLIQVIPKIEEPTTVQNEAIVTSPKTSSMRLKIASVIDRIIALIPEKKVVVQTENLSGIAIPTRKSKLPIIIGIVLLGALLVSIWFGVRARGFQMKKAEYQDQLLEAQHQFEEAQSLAGINSGRAKELILSAKTTVDDLYKRGIEDSDLQVLGASIESKLGEIAGIYTNTPDTFLDLTLIRADFQGSDLAYSAGVIRVLDAEHQKMTLINTNSKKTENIAGLDIISNASQTSAYADESFILSKDGIREVENEIELVVKSDNWDASNVLIGSFGGNLYVLDKSNNKIWRYPGGINTYGEGQEWFAPGINVDVTQVNSWSIDGKVWILNNDSTIDVYERGLPQRFVTEGLGEDFNFRHIFTDESAASIYLLDNDKAKIIVLDKSGAYKGEYYNDLLSKASDFVASEPDKKIIFLAENKLWELPIQH